MTPDVLPPSRPRWWKYMLLGFLLLLLLIPLWTVIVMTLIEPQSLIAPDASWFARLGVWVGLPVLLVSMVLGGHWIKASERSQAQATAEQQNQTVHTAAVAGDAKREYVLEIISLGVTLDKYRQEALWDALAKTNPYVTIRIMDPKKYEWAGNDRYGTTQGHSGQTLENGLRPIPLYYGFPTFNAEPPAFNPIYVDKTNNPAIGLVGGRVGQGMIDYLPVAATRRLSERPDHILDDVFAFFDAHPDVPFVVLNTEDSTAVREDYLLDGKNAEFQDEYHVPSTPDSSALFVLARRERVDPMRPYVFEDKKGDIGDWADDAYCWQLYHYYLDLTDNTLPRPKEVTYTRYPTVEEWLVAARQFAHSPEIKPKGFSALAKELSPVNHAPPSDFKPTPWWPLPWNTVQLSRFDHLPTLGYLHRPTWVKLTDDEGKPLAKTARIQALSAGLQAAMTTIPQDKRPKLPQRFVFGTGDNTDQLIVLHQAISDIDPDFDMSKPTHFINTDRKLGNTGAASLFMQMAIGTMGSYREGGISAAVNLRDPNEASIVLISPPSEEKRKTQQGVFGSHITPDFDPKNYEQP